jgi:hypothetical protein
MLKILFWLLVAINGALFAWGQGLLDRQPVQRTEPQRLTEQLHPEQLILLPPSPPPAAAESESNAAAAAPDQPVVAAAPVSPASLPDPIQVIPASPPPPAEKLLACVEIGNFDLNEAKLFRTKASAAKLSTQPAQRGVQEVASYMVFIAAEDGREGAERRAAELHRLGLNDFYILPASSPLRDAVSLGLFKTEAAAKAYVGQLIPKGVRSARITERKASTNKVAFRWRDLNAADQAGFAALAAAFPNQSRRDCRG